MNSNPDPTYWPVFWTVVLSWLVFGGLFLFRRRPRATAKRERKDASVAGIALVGVGMALVWAVRRPVNTPLIGHFLSGSYVLGVLAVAIAVGSVWLTLAAIRALGKQWNVRATLVEDHKLITTGPYHIVRHPIYVGMLGMMVATGMAGSYWYVLLVAAVLGVTGTVVRTRYEERLLREAFGHEFEAYRRNVRALLPMVY